jgi:small nuclear ribonucleoprotein
MSERPLDVLENSLTETVVVQLKDGEAHAGTLAGYDQHMNVVLEPTEAFDPADFDVPTAESVQGTTIIRGDNVVTINT